MTTPRKARHPYWYDARAAQRAVPERRPPIVFAQPVGQDARDCSARNVGFYPSGERYSLPAYADVVCPGGCGFLLCAKRGPCAPPTPAPIAAPAKAAHAWAAGQWATCVDTAYLCAGRFVPVAEATSAPARESDAPGHER